MYLFLLFFFFEFLWISWGINWKILLGFFWILFEFYWISFGILLDFFWNYPGIHFEFFWKYFWTLLEFFWNFFWILLKFFWNSIWILLEFFWNSFGTLLEFFWNSCGIILAFFWNSSGILLTFCQSSNLCRWNQSISCLKIGLQKNPILIQSRKNRTSIHRVHGHLWWREASSIFARIECNLPWLCLVVYNMVKLFLRMHHHFQAI